MANSMYPDFCCFSLQSLLKNLSFSRIACCIAAILVVATAACELRPTNATEEKTDAIVGGIEDDPNKSLIPAAGLILDYQPGVQNCGISLVDYPDMALTAEHCFKRYTTMLPSYVGFPKVFQTKIDSPAAYNQWTEDLDRRIRLVIPHPLYYHIGTDSWADLSVVLLEEEPIGKSDPQRVPVSVGGLDDSMQGDEFGTIGYGRTTPGPRTAVDPTPPTRKFLTFMSVKKEKDPYWAGSLPMLKANTGSLQSTCWGDSGSGLVRFRNDKVDRILGVLALLGDDCGKENTGGIYAPLSDHKRFLNYARIIRKWCATTHDIIGSRLMCGLMKSTYEAHREELGRPVSQPYVDAVVDIDISKAKFFIVQEFEHQRLRYDDETGRSTHIRFEKFDCDPHSVTSCGTFNYFYRSHDLEPLLGKLDRPHYIAEFLGGADLRRQQRYEKGILVIDWGAYPRRLSPSHAVRVLPWGLDDLRARGGGRFLDAVQDKPPSPDPSDQCVEVETFGPNTLGVVCNVFEEHGVNFANYVLQYGTPILGRAIAWTMRFTIDGREKIVQWFENARLEYDIESKTTQFGAPGAGILSDYR